MKYSAVMAYNTQRGYRLTDAILNSEIIDFSLNTGLRIKKSGTSNIVNPYLTDILVNFMGFYIDDKDEFIYNPPTSIEFSKDGNHWYEHHYEKFWWRPTLLDYVVKDTVIEYKETFESSKIIRRDLMDFPVFDK